MVIRSSDRKLGFELGCFVCQLSSRAWSCTTRVRVALSWPETAKRAVWPWHSNYFVSVTIKAAMANEKGNKTNYDPNIGSGYLSFIIIVKPFIYFTKRGRSAVKLNVLATVFWKTGDRHSFA